MKLADVLKKERELKGISVPSAAEHLGLSLEEYQRLEAGTSPAEKWGPLLAQIAIALRVPTSRLISATGRAAGAGAEACGALIRRSREQAGLGAGDLAARLEMPSAEYEAVERGESPVEAVAPVLLRFAELIEQPIFNLFYPCGLPLESLEDYP